MEAMQHEDPPPPKAPRRAVRWALFVALWTAGVIACILVLRLVLVPILVLLGPGLETVFFDWGVYGAYAERQYRSFDLTSPFLKTIQSSSNCNDGLVLLSLGGPGVKNRAPIILDHNGELVWTTDEFDSSANLKVQQYNGQDHLTFWAGEKFEESGLGIYYILDSSYNVVQTVEAVGDGLYGDLHEFKITPADTALIISYNDTRLDAFDRKRDWIEDETIIDGIVQEVDISTGELIFQWRASDYFEHPAFHATDGRHVAAGALDYFHLNSVEKDNLGNYLISIRHLHTIVYVDGRDGGILWTLGGRASDFEDVSGGAATGFRWQHDVRWVDQRGTISVFNNGVARHHYSDAEVSQGLLLQLDLEKRTVELKQAFQSPANIKSVSQGSVQMLPPAEDGDVHVFVGWGSSAAYSEFDSKGNALCETHFAASSLFYWERAKSYRAIKAPIDWRAEPADWDPSAKFSGGKLYVSWNGATDIASWRLEGRLAKASAEDTDKFEHLDLVTKQWFETAIELPGTAASYSVFRVVALDSNLKEMRYSNVVAAPKTSKVMYLSVAALVVFAAIIVAVVSCYRHVLERRFGYWRPEVAYHKLGEIT